MKVRVENFCALATSPAWQSWLFHNHVELYRSFVKRLHVSQGCTENRRIMVDALKVLNAAGKSDDLVLFLKQHQPGALVESVVVPPSGDKYGVFPDFVAGLLTYPHRHIISGPNLAVAVEKFLADKGESDSLVLEDVAYVEYLNVAEAHLIPLIPATSWRIRAYRKNTPKVS